MEWSGHVNNEKQVETFDSLCFKLTNLYKEQVDLEEKLAAAKKMEDDAATKNSSNTDKDIDEVDIYIRQLKQGEKVNMKVKWQWKKRLLEIENEERQLAKLLKVCKPKEFEIQTWKQKVREEAKQNLITKKSSMPPPPPLPPSVPKPIIETKPSTQTEQMLPPPPPPPLVSTEPKPIQSTPQPDSTVVNSAPTKPKPPPPIQRQKPKRPPVNSKDQYDDADHYSEDKFAEWMPPENEQTGDGRTALNDKYGY